MLTDMWASLVTRIAGGHVKWDDFVGLDMIWSTPPLPVPPRDIASAINRAVGATPADDVARPARDGESS